MLLGAVATHARSTTSYFVEIPHAQYEAEFGRPYRAVGCPATFSATQPPKPSAPAPRLGEHSLATMEELGFRPEETRQLVADGVTAGPSGAGKL